MRFLKFLLLLSEPVGDTAQDHPVSTYIRFRFQASATRFHSPLTLSRPRSRNCRKPSTDLTMPITGSTVHLRCAYKPRPSFVFRRWRMASTTVAQAPKGGGSVKRLSGS